MPPDDPDAVPDEADDTDEKESADDSSLEEDSLEETSDEEEMEEDEEPLTAEEDAEPEEALWDPGCVETLEELPAAALSCVTVMYQWPRSLSKVLFGSAVK